MSAPTIGIRRVLLGLTAKEQVDLAVTSLAVAVLDEFQASIGLFIFVADLFTGRPDDEDVVGAVGDGRFLPRPACRALCPRSGLCGDARPGGRANWSRDRRRRSCALPPSGRSSPRTVLRHICGHQAVDDEVFDAVAARCVTEDIQEPIDGRSPHRVEHPGPILQPIRHVTQERLGRAINARDLLCQALGCTRAGNSPENTQIRSPACIKGMSACISIRLLPCPLMPVQTLTSAGRHSHQS